LTFDGRKGYLDEKDFEEFINLYFDKLAKFEIELLFDYFDT